MRYSKPTDAVLCTVKFECAAWQAAAIAEEGRVLAGCLVRRQIGRLHLCFALVETAEHRSLLTLDLDVLQQRADREPRTTEVRADELRLLVECGYISIRHLQLVRLEHRVAGRTALVA